VAAVSRRPVLIGVVHLLPLPGSPRPSPGLGAVLERALGDAEALTAGGVDGLIVENFGDAPFSRGPVEAATVAALTRIAGEIVRAAPRPSAGGPGSLRVGVNVLRNDPLAALGVAAAVGAGFVRINVHVGAMVTDQGLIEGEARRTLLERNRLGPDAAGIQIVADVLVKHAVPLGAWALDAAARDTAGRGGADVLVVTGSGTGRPTSPADVQAVREAVGDGVLVGGPRVPVWVGSGLTPESAGAFAGLDGAIVGTWLHGDGDLSAPIDVDRVRRMRAALR
jgi:uncharacterized protein